ncbi:hypothetical protein C942_04417 [Photobacterium marinum]|uniref:Uncharacterized protein n=1 Tax=Photobacterium marinum TaxID=1056511 RepID=L8JGU3_9GAMM|nr:hypothetical protein C942_04417 [Photobacterium marinum]
MDYITLKNLRYFKIINDEQLKPLYLEVKKNTKTERYFPLTLQMK